MGRRVSDTFSTLVDQQLGKDREAILALAEKLPELLALQAGGPGGGQPVDLTGLYTKTQSDQRYYTKQQIDQLIANLGGSGPVVPPPVVATINNTLASSVLPVSEVQDLVPAITSIDNRLVALGV